MTRDEALTSSQALRAFQAEWKIDAYPHEASNHVVLLEDKLEKALDLLYENSIEHEIGLPPRFVDDPCF